jgi:hypothetical protein
MGRNVVQYVSVAVVGGTIGRLPAQRRRFPPNFWSRYDTNININAQAMHDGTG